jgi:DNA-binding beta-propeller fold protein YncE
MVSVRQRLLAQTMAVLALGAAVSAAQGVSASPAPGGTPLWVARYDGPSNGDDNAFSVAASSDGAKVFVTGSSLGTGSGYDYATAGYEAASGALMWAKRYQGPAGDDVPSSIAVSPDGSRVFVTGFSDGGPGVGEDYATVSYDAATGAFVWGKRYDAGQDFAQSIAVSPDGTMVLVTGYSGWDYATVAYEAATGAERWVARHTGPRYDYVHSVAVSPDGTKVFVTGSSERAAIEDAFDYATVAYHAATGAVVWARRYNGPGRGDDIAYSVAASPDGSRVFVTGTSWGTGSAFDYATVAYDGGTGAFLWGRRYDGPGNFFDTANVVAVSQDGSRIFVTGSSVGAESAGDYATVAYDAETGGLQWAKRYNGPGNYIDSGDSLAVSADGSKVYVTGRSDRVVGDADYATIAYDAATGVVQWLERFSGPGHSFDIGYSVAASPDGSKVFVTGSSWGTDSTFDYATLAYAA